MQQKIWIQLNVHIITANQSKDKLLVEVYYKWDLTSELTRIHKKLYD